MSEQIRFFLPGPTYVTQDLRDAMTQHPMGHRGPDFKALYAKIREGLPSLFGTSQEVMVVTSSGSLAWDIAVVSTLKSDVLCLTNGAFSERFLTTCKAWGKTADQVSAPWGHPIDPEMVRQALRRKRYEAVTMAHNETSTGTLSPLEDIARVVREESDALLYVDAVSSLGGTEIEVDAWGIDYLFTGSQKALALPPGLCFITASDRALAKAESIENRGYYTDLRRYHAKHCAGGTITTPAIPQIWALERQLEKIREEGLKARFDRHRTLRQRSEEWASARGFTYASDPSGASPTVSCLKPPAGVDAPELVKALAARGITVGGGYGAWKPETFRIGHMGEVRMNDLNHLFDTIDEIVAGL